jgi:hypothetical protein
MSLGDGGIEQIEATLEETFHEEDEVLTTAEPISKIFLEEYKEINKDKSPILFDLFKGKESIPARLLNALFCELQNVLKKNDSSVDFTYANGKTWTRHHLTQSENTTFLPGICSETEMD